MLLSSGRNVARFRLLSRAIPRTRMPPLRAHLVPPVSTFTTSTGPKGGKFSLGTVAMVVGGALLLGVSAYATNSTAGKLKKESSKEKKKRHPSLPDHPLSPEESTKKLRSAEKTVPMPYSPVIQRLDSAQVPANSPCEDRRSWHALSDGASWLLGIYDGHSGTECSELIRKRLPARVAAEYARRKEGEGVDGAEEIAEAMRRAYVAVDRDIVEGALEQIGAGTTVEEGRRVLGPAMAGACALMTVVDAVSGEVVTACTGDARAIMGVERADGTWGAVRLSEDQTARNPAERARVCAEHPKEDPAVLLYHNRILGGLEPCRAFGDARYKWAEATTAMVVGRFFPDKRGPPKELRTPPYVTARPEVTRHKIDATCRFIVMATDGLWDELTDEEVVDVVRGYAGGGRGGAWAFEDENAATGVIRNSLGGKDVERLGYKLALQAPLARRYRDDVTVTVLFFGSDVGGKEWNERVKAGRAA